MSEGETPEAHPKAGSREGRQGARSGALRSSPCRPGAGRSVWSVWPAPDIRTAAAGRGSNATPGHRAKSAGQLLADAALQRTLPGGEGTDPAALQESDQKILQHLWFTFWFLSFHFKATFLRLAWMPTSHTRPARRRAQQTPSTRAAGAQPTPAAGRELVPAPFRAVPAARPPAAAWPSVRPSIHRSVRLSIHSSQPQALPPAGLPARPLRLPSAAGCTPEPG